MTSDFDDPGDTADPQSLWPDDELESWLSSPDDPMIPDVLTGEIHSDPQLDSTLAHLLTQLPPELDDPYLLGSLVDATILARTAR